MLIVGLTGGIATGKSTVAKYLRSRGFTLIDADKEAHMVVEPGQPAYHAIMEKFGADFIDSEGRLKRDDLASEIFHNVEKRRLLNSIVHPEVRKRLVSRVLGAAIKFTRICFVDVPLLFETGSNRFMMKTIVVSCNKDQQLARLMHRDGFSEEDALARINAQMDMAEKRRKATHVIDNNGTLEETFAQVEFILKQLKRSWIPDVFRFLIFTFIASIIFTGYISCYLLL